MAPIFADLAKKHPNAVFLKVDVDELKVVELLSSLQIIVIQLPCFFLCMFS